MSQAAHVRPGWPHVCRLIALHVLPVQQPVGHDVALQTHWPPTQSCPGSHAPPVPQTHWPPRHVSPRWLVAQSKHTTPLVPHGAGPPSLRWQTPLKQQPFGQLVALQPEQVVPSQVLPDGQLWHALPFAPQASS